MHSVDLYQAVGGRRVCRRLSEAFYARVQHDPVLRPFFPGKTMRCAIEAFAAFLAQLLGGPAEDARKRWSLSLRESHLRFRIGPAERTAWMKNMIAALDEVPVGQPVRLALLDLFDRSSAYIVNTGQSSSAPDPSANPSDHLIHREISQRWREQRELDELVAAIGRDDSRRGSELTQSPMLQARFARDRAVFAHALGLMIGCGNRAFLEYAQREIQADPSLVHIPNRYGRTLLHDASARGNLPAVELMLRLGADPNVRSSGGHTPLYCVANECQAPGGGAVVRALVRAGARVDSPSDAKRCTPLHMAARRGNTGVAEALLDCGADSNAQDTTGATPLERARNCRKAGVASLLAARAADPRLSPPDRRRSARAGGAGKARR